MSEIEGTAAILSPCGRIYKAFFSTYIHSAAPIFGIALRRDGR
jgi:hypothetical protein